MIPRRIAPFITSAATVAGFWAAPLLEAQSGGSARRVWVDPLPRNGVLGSPSPDGRLVPFLDMRSGDVAVRDIVTGQERRVTNEGSWDKDGNDFAYWPVFSRDGNSIAYQWYDGTLRGYEVRVIGADGSSPHSIYHAPARPVDWTPDGRFVVATVTTVDQTAQIAFIPVGGGAPRIVRSFLAARRWARIGDREGCE
jgi:hypothetical protein